MEGNGESSKPNVYDPLKDKRFEEKNIPKFEITKKEARQVGVEMPGHENSNLSPSKKFDFNEPTKLQEEPLRDVDSVLPEFVDDDTADKWSREAQQAQVNKTGESKSFFSRLRDRFFKQDRTVSSNETPGLRDLSDLKVKSFDEDASRKYVDEKISEIADKSGTRFAPDIEDSIKTEDNGFEPPIPYMDEDSMEDTKPVQADIDTQPIKPLPTQLLEDETDLDKRLDEIIDAGNKVAPPKNSSTETKPSISKSSSEKLPDGYRKVQGTKSFPDRYQLEMDMVDGPVDVIVELAKNAPDKDKLTLIIEDKVSEQKRHRIMESVWLKNKNPNSEMFEFIQTTEGVWFRATRDARGDVIDSYKRYIPSERILNILQPLENSQSSRPQVQVKVA